MDYSYNCLYFSQDYKIYKIFYSCQSCQSCKGVVGFIYEKFVLHGFSEKWVWMSIP